MNKENKLIIEQINKFGKVPETYELLQTIKELENINEKLSLALESAENKIDKAIAIYDKCTKTQDFSTCDLDMYEVLKGSDK